MDRYFREPSLNAPGLPDRQSENRATTRLSSVAIFDNSLLATEICSAALVLCIDRFRMVIKF